MAPDFPAQPPSPAAAPAFATVPAASVIDECLRVQGDVPPRSALARFFGRSPLSPESRPWYAGALGELEVARRLEDLGPEWTVLHAVPIGTRGSDIDHVAVGPAGVFTINTKFHEDAKVWVGSRRLLVNGQPKDHLRNSRYEAQRVSKILTSAAGVEVHASAVVVIVGAKEIIIREQPADVAVLRSSGLIRWLRRQKSSLTPAQTAAITDAATRRATWTSAELDASVDSAAFPALRREVNAAHRVRMGWGIAVVLAILGVVAPGAIQFFTGALGG